MSFTTTVDPDGVTNHQFTARPVLSHDEARRTALTDADFGRSHYGQAKPYVHDPESERKDPTIQARRTGLR